LRVLRFASRFRFLVQGPGARGDGLGLRVSGGHLPALGRRGLDRSHLHAHKHSAQVMVHHSSLSFALPPSHSLSVPLSLTRTNTCTNTKTLSTGCGPPHGEAQQGSGFKVQGGWLRVEY